MSNSRKYSSAVVDGYERAASRAMLYPVGFKKEDFKKPQVGIASTWSMVTPCNMHINDLADEAEIGVNSAGGKAVIFNTITISDGISMGSEGMKYSLVSREVIADSIETVVACQGFDGVVAIGGCDKNMPGCLMGLARLNRPSVFVYGGTIQPGKNHTDVVSVFEAVGKRANNDITDIELEQIESTAIPGPGSCGGMYTANTMASAIEALGMSLPNSSSQDAISDDKNSDSLRAGEAVLNLLDKDIKPSDIMTKKAFENAKQYFITENYKSAIIALENVLIDFPSYTNREEVHFLIVKSSYLLAVNSISTKVTSRLKATLDAYAQFKDNYPNSDFIKDLEKTYNKTNQTLTELKENKDEI